MHARGASAKGFFEVSFLPSLPKFHCSNAPPDTSTVCLSESACFLTLTPISLPLFMSAEDDKVRSRRSVRGRTLLRYLLTGSEGKVISFRNMSLT